MITVQEIRCASDSFEKRALEWCNDQFENSERPSAQRHALDFLKCSNWMSWIMNKSTFLHPKSKSMREKFRVTVYFIYVLIIIRTNKNNNFITNLSIFIIPKYMGEKNINKKINFIISGKCCYLNFIDQFK